MATLSFQQFTPLHRPQILSRSTAIKAILRGKALASWKMMIKNEKRTVKDEEVFIDDRSLIFGNGTKLKVWFFFKFFFFQQN